MGVRGGCVSIENLSADVATRTVVVDERYEGPPGIANGGYVGGLIAEGLSGAVEVRLHAPVPVGRALVLRYENDAATLSDGAKILAAGRAGRAPAEPPASVDFAEAAGLRGSIDDHPFPNCFVCGPHRSADDGLQLIPAPVPGRDVMAAAWVPHESLAAPDGTIPSRFVWSALDCPSFWPVAGPGEVALLGTLGGRVFREVSPGERCVVVSWPRERRGRKWLSGSAVLDEAGATVGIADATWIQIN